MKKLFAILVFLVFQMICSDIFGKEVPTTKSYYVIDGFCCGGEDSDPHAVFGIEASDGYILLGKALDINSKEDGFAVKIRKNLPNEKLFLQKSFFTKKKLKNLRILHVTNFNERLDGRLFFNTGRRINNGLFKMLEAYVVPA